MKFCLLGPYAEPMPSIGEHQHASKEAGVQ